VKGARNSPRGREARKRRAQASPATVDTASRPVQQAYRASREGRGMDASRGYAAPLPDELWARVLAHCDFAAVARLLCCSRQLRRLGDATEVWQRLCTAHAFNRTPRAGLVLDWKALFRDRRARLLRMPFATHAH
jgi:hypothetical protein